MSGTVADLLNCDREPIHIPGSIQPHGILLVVDGNLRVCGTAGDVENRLSCTEWQDAALVEFVGPEIAANAAALATAAHPVSFLGRLETADEVFDVSGHRSGPLILVEFEPAERAAGLSEQVIDQIDIAVAEFERATTIAALCERAAARFRALTGFDRVMIYRFLESGSGRVVGEARRDGLHSFLNHHFPASDIPKQARALYIRNLTRVIPDVNYQPAPLRGGGSAAGPLDLSDSVLRSVSPIHLQYLRNMDVAASASISIVKEGVLWGLIACHHETPRLLPYAARATCRTLAAGLARQIKVKEEIETYRQRISLRAFEDEIVALLSRETTLDDVIASHFGEITRMQDADGAAVMRGSGLFAAGVRPADRDIRALAQWLLSRADPVFGTSHLQAEYPASADFAASGSGVLAVILSSEEPWLLIWFRAEEIETIEWAGNPHKAPNGELGGELTPRASFAAWKETVRGRSRRWTLPEVEAAGRLRSALIDARQTRRIKELNRRLTEILQDKDALLKQKDYLIGEVNHRVQNSLQLVSGFLSLQARASHNQEVTSALEEARRRLRAVSLVHRRLYRGEQMQGVDVARYIEELCLELVTSMGREWSQLLSLDLAPIMVSTDRAVTLGLVVTELIININKYAYKGAAGPIEVALSQDRANLHLVVADKGMGKNSAQEGFGSRMIAGLVRQLGGTLTREDNEPGLRTVLTAPVASTS